MDTAFLKRNKVQLKDYDSEKDIAFRLSLSNLSFLQVEILEEILFNPSTIPLVNLSRNLEIPLPQLRECMDCLEPLGCGIEDDLLCVGKETKRYLEIEMERFKETFAPDLSFFQSLLKKVPIHVLPNWYSIPRTSDHIAFSIIEKHLNYPNLYERHLLEIKNYPLIERVLSLLFSKTCKKIDIAELEIFLKISQEELEALLIQLEFYFAAFVCYEKENSHFKRVLRPLKEWENYLTFLQQKKQSSLAIMFPLPLPSFLQDLKKTLCFFKENSPSKEAFFKKNPLSLKNPFYLKNAYLSKIVKKAEEGFLVQETKGLTLTQLGRAWLSCSEKDQALFLYRKTVSENSFFSEKCMKELEKILQGFPRQSWICLETVWETGLICLGEETKIRLKRIGKNWNYQFPQYTEEEKEYLKKLFIECFFEAGLILLGSCQERLFFRLTSLGEMFVME